ncbi:xanthine dehydrogenase family protein molybdopterin-binding subunit [uncultured Enterovirga sp.]|uniref:xanthine dehydrogenase family protein molybdopterin-binding subunit n=1 Tax=uncultured Enterovirga sp. TaxID=2026352 RepID=UPI0035CC7754
MRPTKFGIGQPARRTEDPRLVTGQGRYTDDILPEGCRYAALMRSPHAHARFEVGDLAPVRAMPGVRLVLVHADVSGYGDLPCGAPAKHSDGSTMTLPAYPLLADGVVRHVGDAVAFVVADTPAQARDAADSIPVQWEPEHAVVGITGAESGAAGAVWPEVADNVAFDTELGDSAAAAAAFARADRTVSLGLVNNRLVTNYMEARACIGEYDPGSQGWTLTLGSQGAHGIRDVLAGAILKVDPERVRVLTPDVGGGFGTKLFMFREYPLCCIAAERTGAPVRWTSDRSEHFVADAQGRDNLVTAELALDAEGRFLGLRIDLKADMGGYLSAYAPYIPTLGAEMAPGVYHIPAVHVRIRGYYTHTLPVDAYRGAGRPEAAYLIERLVEYAATEIGMDPQALRALNFIQPGQMPYRTATGKVYDTGDFAGTMRLAQERADWAGFPARRDEAARRGCHRGIGLATYVEACAGGGGERALVRLDADGGVTVLIGTQSSGQGHETAYAQLVGQELDLPPERIRVVQGDTSAIRTGGGTGGSRSIPVGGASVTGASKRLAEQLKLLASDALEAGIADLEIVDGAVRVVGTDRSASFSDLAASAGSTPEKLEADDTWTPPEATYPNGTHVCEVEFDPDLGEVEVKSYVVVDDFGVTLNPLLLAGQVHGGIAQGIGQALHERTVYDTSGQLVTASFMDYRLPRAADIPDIRFETRNVPSTTNALGMKGAGEAGAIGSCPAVMNAVVDALRHGYGIRHIDMPATPDAIRAAIRQVPPLSIAAE